MMQLARATRRAASRAAPPCSTSARRWFSKEVEDSPPPPVEDGGDAEGVPPPPDSDSLEAAESVGVALPPNLTLSDPSALEPGSLLDEVGASQGMMGFSAREATVETSAASLEIPVESFATESGSEESKTVTLHPDIFGAHVRRDLIHRVVVWQRAKRRQGTHKQKNISEVSGSGKKPWAQKGTGRARAGHRRPPHWRGGARAHPKQPKKYEFQLQKRVKNQALRAALSAKVREGALRVVDAGSIKTHKTAPMVEWLAEREVDSALVVDARKGTGEDEDGGGDEGNELLAMACGNIQNVQVILSKGANVYDIVRRKDLILTVDGLEALTERLLTTGKADEGKKSAVASLEEQAAIREMVAAQLSQADQVQSDE